MSRLARLRASARELTEQWVRNLPAARRLRFWLAIEAIERYAGGRPLTVLDAGCGEGLLAEALARRNPGWSVVAVDIDEDQLQRGQRRLASSGLENVRFEPRDLTQDLGQSEYDAVLAIECLEEIPDDNAALAHMGRTLRPGGLFVVHVPETGWRPVLPGSERTWRHEVRHGYGAGELTSMLSGIGLTVTVVRPSTRGAVRAAQELRDRIKHRGLKLQLLAYPASVAAVWLERRRLTWGEPRALFFEAVRR
jgi:2-polyprenyl-3-methyl-5-hydroxy-6-metoxy-1,4-benzoquinol methylase